MIDLTKPVRTKGGNKVRILAIDVSGKYPIAAVVENGMGGISRMAKARWTWRTSMAADRLDLALTIALYVIALGMIILRMAM